MTDYVALFTTIIGILLVITSVALWFVKTLRTFLHDMHLVYVTYKNAKADKKLTHVEKDAILDQFEFALTNLNKNVKKLLLRTSD